MEEYLEISWLSNLQVVLFHNIHIYPENRKHYVPGSWSTSSSSTTTSDVEHTMLRPLSPSLPVIDKKSIWTDDFLLSSRQKQIVSNTHPPTISLRSRLFVVSIVHSMNTGHCCNPGIVRRGNRELVCPGHATKHRTKYSGLKWAEQILELIVGSHLARLVFTNSIHFLLLFFASTLWSLENGILCSVIPFWASGTFVQPPAIHLYGIINYVVFSWPKRRLVRTA